MKRVTVRGCAEADRDHARNPRAYAHVGHYPGAICLAQASVFLPIGFLLGILLHECGHLAELPGEHTERDADRAGERLAGVTIERRKHGKALNLEYVPPADQARAIQYLRRTTNF